ncbi:MAG: hypothetical protein HY660_05300 [Armatimonadetes bacterium]|nr:hypothetical protein [Armatimonadota bacterium]
MAVRRVAVDWDDLEMALTSHMDEWAFYLDLRTGRVHMVPVFPSEGEDVELSEQEIDAGLAAEDLVPVEPFPSSLEYGWMVEFADSVAEQRLRGLLRVALDGRGAFRRFKNVLADHPDERARWFAYRDWHLRATLQLMSEDE